MAEPESEPRCKCGYDKRHPMVSAEPRYDAKGWFWLIMGATPDPVRVVFKCRRCDQVIDESDDPEELKRA